MISRSQILQQSELATSKFIRYSLCNEQKYPILLRTGKDTWQISTGQEVGYSIAMHNVSYKEIYSALSENKLYNFKMMDGALIQMIYEFRKNELLSHRLAFFPSPFLEEYQNNPEVYEQDDIYADILRREIVPFPIRFDYDHSDKKHLIIKHPKSHLTLGQYKNCRIPVSAPLTPYLFLGFILRNFYYTAFDNVSNELKFVGEYCDETIHHQEKSVSFLQLPKC